MKKGFFTKVLEMVSAIPVGGNPKPLTIDELLDLEHWWNWHYKWEQFRIIAYPDPEEAAVQIFFCCVWDELVYEGPGIEFNPRDGLQTEPGRIIRVVESLARGIEDIGDLEAFLRLWIIMISRYLAPNVQEISDFWEKCSLPEQERTATVEMWSRKTLDDYVRELLRIVSQEQLLIEYKRRWEKTY